MVQKLPSLDVPMTLDEVALFCSVTSSRWTRKVAILERKNLLEPAAKARDVLHTVQPAEHRPRQRPPAYQLPPR